MKTLKPIFFLLSFSFLLLSGMKCKKDKTEPAEDQLPAATQVGANTFGCLVNGKVFLPKAGLGQFAYQCYYQFVDNTYYFSVSASRKEDNGNELSSVSINTNDIQFNDKFTLPIQAAGKGVGSGEYVYFFRGGNFIDYKSLNSPQMGELKITKFDLTNQIVSGTFWYDAINEKGEKVEVREGRFDMKFTR